MVWFYCDDCGDSIKKPKLAGHFRTCRGQTFTCVDCSRVFDRSSAAGHSTCVSEHEKYALGATKPGGFAAQGFFKEGQPQQQQQGTANGSEEIVGPQFLSERPPWKCSCCNVNCTSRDTLLGHAAGVKHKRRARAALGISGQQQQANSAAAEQKPEQQLVAEGAPVAGVVAPVVLVGKRDNPDAVEAVLIQQDEQPSKKQKKDKKEKKNKSSEQQKNTLAATDAQVAVEAAAAADGKEVDGKPSSKKTKKHRKAAAVEEAVAAVEPTSPAIATSRKQQEGSPVEPPKDKPSKKGKKRKQTQQQRLPDFAPLLAVAHKKLKKKGRLRLKKLEAMLRETANGGFSQDVVAAVIEQLLAAAEVKLDGEDTLVWQAS